MTAKRSRSILSDLVGRPQESRPTVKTYSAPRGQVAPLYRKRAPHAQWSGSFVTMQESQYADLLLSYNANNDFVGIDIFRAFGTGSFVRWTTVAVDHESGKNGLRDYEVVREQPSYYYAIFFDDMVRFSERTEICAVRYQSDISSSALSSGSGAATIISAQEDTGSGDTLVLVKWNQPSSRTEKPSSFIIRDAQGTLLGQTNEITQPVLLKGKVDQIQIQAVDAKGQLLTVDKQPTLCSARLDFNYLLQPLQGLVVRCDYNQGVIALDIEHDAMLAQGVANITVLKRNISRCESSYTKPDSSWQQNNIVLAEGQQTTLKDRTVRDDENYEYRVVGYDLAGTQKALALRKVFFKAPVLAKTEVPIATGMLRK